MLSAKPQVVIDTNVWLSGVIFGGKPEQVLRRFVDGSLIVVTSEEMLSELRRKVLQKFPHYAPYLGALEASIREKALLVQLGSQPVRVSRDPDDNIVIETALLGRAHYVISGDKDLLVVNVYNDISIVTPAEFLDELS